MEVKCLQDLIEKWCPHDTINLSFYFEVWCNLTFLIFFWLSKLFILPLSLWINNLFYSKVSRIFILLKFRTEFYLKKFYDKTITMKKLYGGRGCTTWNVRLKWDWRVFEYSNSEDKGVGEVITSRKKEYGIYERNLMIKLISNS